MSLSVKAAVTAARTMIKVRIRRREPSTTQGMQNNPERQNSPGGAGQGVGHAGEEGRRQGEREKEREGGQGGKWKVVNERGNCH